MGCWGVRPYENDGAADWFAELWEALPLPAKVEETLRLDPRDNHEQIRAAVHILLQLGQVYIWPVKTLDQHLDLAAKRLEEIKGMELYEEQEFQIALQEEITSLRSRTSEKFKNHEG